MKKLNKDTVFIDVSDYCRRLICKLIGHKNKEVVKRRNIPWSLTPMPSVIKCLRCEEVR